MGLHGPFPTTPTIPHIVFSSTLNSFESYIKRKAQIKDSSGLLLGHGGMLDRLDSLILTTPVTMFYVIAYYL